jgi:membrane associated rhomboid family serine protease
VFENRHFYYANQMLSDRSYMRDSYPRTTRSALVWLVSATIGGFILINLFQNWFVTYSFRNLFALSIPDIRAGYGWQLLSYGFVHAAGEAFDVLVFCFNLLCLYLLGRELEFLLGSKRFVSLYLSGILFGALAWVATHWSTGSVPPLMGAWPGIVALFTVYACVNANQPVPLLVFFVFPVTLRPKYILWAALILECAGFILLELPRKTTFLGYHSAHLGGILAGFLYYRFVHLREWRTPDGVAEVELPRWFRKKQQAPAEEAPVYTLNLDKQGLKAEVDRILDKINSEGLASLTADEKKLLDSAKDLMSRR